MTKTNVTVGACAALLWAGMALATATPEQTCEAGKNLAAGRYASCRQTAERSLVLNGNAAKYAANVARCNTALVTKWARLEQWAIARGSTCPSSGDEAVMQTFLTANADAVATALHTPPLITDVATCNAELATCTAGAGLGTAVAGDVLSGKTFSSSAGHALPGTMPNNGAVTLTPGTSNHTIAVGYHNGLGYCAGDADLVPGNIKSGVNLFGVSGSSTVVDTSGATATAADMVSGKTAYTSGILVTGSATAGSNVNGANGLKTFTIPDGLYAGTKTATANDTNLVASNIISGVTIFGVTGTAGVAPASEPLRTGEMQCDQGSGTLGACPGSPNGQDGSVLKGATRSYTDNGNGTITDNTTGLMWEKQSSDGTIHDYSTNYTWSGGFGKITALNTANFAGHNDWRFPNLNELQTLANYGAYSPAIDAIFDTNCTAGCTVATCSCTMVDGYWTSTNDEANPPAAWNVWFLNGNVDTVNKADRRWVRGVRGGS